MGDFVFFICASRLGLSLMFILRFALGIVVNVYFALRAWDWSKMSIKEP